MSQQVQKQLISLLGRPLPQGWMSHPTPVLDGGAHYSSPAGLSIIESIGIEDDGKRWHHVSAAYQHRLPSWEDLLMVKRLLMGPDSTAIQILPPARKHVSIHNYALHLFHCLDTDAPLPDFTRGRRQI